MLIKFEASDEDVALMKTFTGQSVGSKAFHRAALDALDLAKQLREANSKLADARRTIAVQRQTLEAARSAAAMLLEKVGQGDLIDG